jgi:peptide/nickel transport system permease protein
MNFWETFYKNKLMLYGGGLVTLLLIISLMAPWLAPYDPGQIDLTNVLTSPSIKHFCGTDQLGREPYQDIMEAGLIRSSCGLWILCFVSPHFS